ncbi:DUF1574 domain-containing protein [Trichocoleus sp. FACHB-262]|uniref:DUF1574 domain-containing protein n=1 Tax=Trichocoleus sp. FACHB-262 TaxID=2692869 RepID=UPI00168A3DB9|nr:DUF1574 domain-containing protein [Trichocoleus sp. FACHB-262]MBD2120198.1 DUF1574 domain-containing protein [Trichocoleus sp. FACHB-262]
MLNVNERASGRQAVITQWVVRAINLQGVQVQVRFRGNLVHILCEGHQAPDSAVVMSRVVEALSQADLAALLPPDPHPIYQIFLYGRGFSSDRPSWSEPIYLNQLDRHLEQLKHLQPPPPDLSSFTLRQPPIRSRSNSTTSDSTTTAVKAGPTTQKSNRPPGSPATATQPKAPVPSVPPQSTSAAGTALLVPNRTLAKQGRPDAIARYLSETLGAMGVAVEVTAKAIPCTPDAATDSQHRNQRLWIICEAPYSPDPASLAEPIAQKLRGLELDSFRDALVFSQVSGEPRPDWRLQVDLTPPDEMLKEWARWGDVQAIARLLNPPLAADQVEVVAELKESTLHLLCSVKSAKSSSSSNSLAAPASGAPSQATVVPTISTLLEALAPQGIHAATLYGQVAGQEAPAWVDWLNLPAAQHGALAESALGLAQQGDRPALQFLLSRLLNPNLDWRLATGGVRIQVLDREDLLHIMSDAPVCPKQKQVGPAVAKFVRQLQIPNVSGIRVYGRRAGQKRPLWSYGADFATRDRLVPEATPEFAASDAYVNELLTQPNEIGLRPELTSEALQAALSQTTQRVTHRLQQLLLQSQLFLPSDQPLGQQAGYKGAAVAVVWGTLGLLLTLQADWVLGQILQVRTNVASVDARPKTASTKASTAAKSVASKSRPPLAVPKPPASLKKSPGEDKTAFNASGFTESIPPAASLADETGISAKPLPAEPLKATATSVAILAAARSPYPTFNSRQLDEKLALYYQRLAESGPPDILIIGSSRALRGVDPAALQKALAAQGYAGLSVFNFGVNGATAQVVDVILRQVLTPAQMPKLIVWADGARAFNSGRVDITYNAIAASEGYRQVLAGTVPDTPSGTASSAATTVATSNLSTATPAGTPADTNKTVGTSLAASYQALNQWMNESLGAFSATYAQRDQLKQLLQQQWAGVLKPEPTLEQLLATQGQFGAKSASPNAEGVETDSLLYAIDFDGFLPLSLRFNPATYYQKYAKVSGDYDSDYDSFELKGKQTQALASLVQFTQAKQIPLVFVNLPLTKDYLDAVRMEHEEQFRQQMLRLATENGFVFRDLSQLWPAENDYFSDPSHLNRYGAYEVSNRLAQDPLVPWPRSQTSASNTP